MRHKKLKLITLLLLGFGLMGLQGQTTGTFTDTRDGKVYKTVKIGEQVWMAENLNFKTNKPYFDYPDKGDINLGLLYSWEAAQDACPDGWRLPSKDDFAVLLKENGDYVGLNRKKKAYKTFIGGRNSGFSVLFGGSYHKGKVYNFNQIATYWASTIHHQYKDEIYAWGITFWRAKKWVTLGFGVAEAYRSIRCVKD